MSAKTAGSLFWLFVAAVAAFVIYWELHHPPPLPAINQVAKRPVELPTVTPEQPFRLPVRQLYGDIINRPVFIPARRPEPPAPPEETQAPKPPPEPEQKFMLLGVLISPSLQAALLRPQEPNAKTVRVKQGQLLGEWRLEAIFPNRVILRKDQLTQELPLARLKKSAPIRGVRAGVKPPQASPAPVFGAAPTPPESGGAKPPQASPAPVFGATPTPPESRSATSAPHVPPVPPPQ